MNNPDTELDADHLLNLLNIMMRQRRRQQLERIDKLFELLQHARNTNDIGTTSPTTLQEAVDVLYTIRRNL